MCILKMLKGKIIQTRRKGCEYTELTFHKYELQPCNVHTVKSVKDIVFAKELKHTSSNWSTVTYCIMYHLNYIMLALSLKHKTQITPEYHSKRNTKRQATQHD